MYEIDITSIVLLWFLELLKTSLERLYGRIEHLQIRD
jgi:hypothetical protein